MRKRQYKEWIEEKTVKMRMELPSVMERWRNIEAAILETKQIKTLAYTCITTLSFIGKLNHMREREQVSADMRE